MTNRYIQIGSGIMTLEPVFVWLSDEIILEWLLNKEGRMTQAANENLRWRSFEIERIVCQECGDDDIDAADLALDEPRPKSIRY